MDAEQLRRYVVRPALEAIDLHSDAAEDLVMGTASQESHLKFIQQLNGGPAMGLFQMEPATYEDHWSNWLLNRPDLACKVRNAISTSQGIPSADRMRWDLRFAAIMCRIHYRRRPEPLPEYGDIWAYANYWKDHYNTHLGAGTPEEFYENYRKVGRKS